MKKFLDVWTKVLWYITAVMVLATIVVITMQIVWRYVLNDPLSWTEQISRYLFVWIVMLAVPVGLYRSGLYNFDLLLEKLHGTASLVVRTLNLAGLPDLLRLLFIQCRTALHQGRVAVRAGRTHQDAVVSISRSPSVPQRCF